MKYEKDSNQIKVVENAWKKAIERFDQGAFVQKKFGK